MPEMIQLVDENDVPTKPAPRDEALAKGLRHRLVQIVLRDEEGNFLLQKRSMAKKRLPGLWTVAASGGVDPGESYETAAPRELLEEVGVRTELTQLGTFKHEYLTADHDVRQFVGVFEGRVPHDVPLRLQPEEVSETKWVSPDELRTLLRTDPAQMTPSGRAVIQQFFLTD